MADLIRNIPVDIARFYNLTCVSAPEARADFETGAARMDRTTGKPLYLVGVMARIPDDRKAYVLDITVAGEPEGLVEGQPVALHNLTVSPWNTDTGNGVAYRADAITPARPSTAPASVEASTSAARAARTASGGGGS